ncbi:MAG: ybaK [Rhizorhabdus sp.]|nr:ybaK [Rhizorhabdus sp.]
MSRSTRATIDLAKAGINFTTHSYDYAPGTGRVGLQAADALGESPARVLKTLMIEVDGAPACAIIPSDCELALKKVAAALGGKAARMMPPAQAERLTGYHVGGISPFGQKKRVPTAIEAAALDEPYVFINGGQRGLQVRLDPKGAARMLGAVVASVIV